MEPSVPAWTAQYAAGADTTIREEVSRRLENRGSFEETRRNLSNPDQSYETFRRVRRK